MQHPTRRTARHAVAGLFAASALVLAGCGDTAGPEEGVTVEDIQEEAGEEGRLDPETAPVPRYDTSMYEDFDTYVGEEVTVSADVNEIYSPTSFSIAGTEDTMVDPLLVVGATEFQGIEPGMTVQVTGTVREAFDLPVAEQEVGVDLADDLADNWAQKPYIVAESVEEYQPAEQ